MNALKNLKINGLKYLRINELKHLIPKPGSRDDTELGDLIESKREVETKIHKLFKEKKELESRIEKKELESRTRQFQEIEDGKKEEISEFPWREEIFPPLRRNMDSEVSGLIEIETVVLQKEDAGIPERTDDKIDKKVENPDKSLESKETGETRDGNIAEIEVKEKVKSASEENEVKSNEEIELSNIVERAGEIDFTENTDGTKTVEPPLENNEKVEDGIPAIKDNEKVEDRIPTIKDNEKEEDENPEKGKIESGKPASGIFGNSLIQDLMESEDLCIEEEQNFMKYIGESSVEGLIVDLKELKELLNETGT